MWRKRTQLREEEEEDRERKDILFPLLVLRKCERRGFLHGFGVKMEGEELNGVFTFYITAKSRLW